MAVMAWRSMFGSTALLSLRFLLVSRNSSTKKLLLDPRSSGREKVSESMVYSLSSESRYMNATLWAPYLYLMKDGPLSTRTIPMYPISSISNSSASNRYSGSSMIARSARSSLIMRMLYSSSETTMLAPGIFNEDMTDIVRSSVTGLQQTVNPLSVSQRWPMDLAREAILSPSSVRTEPAGVVLTTGAPAASSIWWMYLWTTGTDMPSLLAAAFWLPASCTASSASSCLTVTVLPLMTWEFLTVMSMAEGVLSWKITPAAGDPHVKVDVAHPPDGVDMTGVERSSETVVVGLGSPIMCDDAVGLRVSDAIAAMDLEGVDCCQEAVGGLDILPVIHGYRFAIIVDAIQTGEYGPGTVMLFSESDFDDVIAHASSHDVNLPTAMRIGRQMDPDIMPEAVRFVAIEVQDINTVTETMTPEVEASVDSACRAVLHIMGELTGREPRRRIS